MSVGSTLKRKAKGERPYFFDDPNVDRVVSMVMGLAGEVAVLHDRLDTLERLLEAGHVGSGGGFLGGMSSDKYAKITNISKATATRDLADLLANGLIRVEGVGKATRYAVNVPGWVQPALKS
jgi:DNA-binding transcriptional ArsR family regulator